MSWMKKGFTKQTEAPEKKLVPQARRFWMKEGTSRTITFVDAEPTVIFEHNLNEDGHWRNWYTCAPRGRDGAEDCPVCSATKDKPYEVAYFTIVDHNKWVDRNGRSHENEKKLYGVKTSSSTYRILSGFAEDPADDGDGLRGLTMTVTRSTRRAANVGDHFSVTARQDMDGAPEPFDYQEVLAPRDYQAVPVDPPADSSSQGPKLVWNASPLSDDDVLS